MNLSNEKNTLLNTVSRLAVDFGARASAKFVTRGAMAAAALTVVTYAVSSSGPAIAACTPGMTATADGQTFTCSNATGGGFDGDGYDDLKVSVTEDGHVINGGGIAIDLGKGTEGGTAKDDAKATTNNSEIFVFDLFFGGTTVGEVAGSTTAILIEGDNNTVNNGFTKLADIVGGGQINGGDDGIVIKGAGNTVNNFDNNNGTNSGIIQGGGGADDDGIVLTGGTSGSPNVVNNGLVGKGASYITSGGTTNVLDTGDDGIDATGYTNVNNGGNGIIEGGDRGIQLHGTPATYNIANDGKITGHTDDGIVVQGTGGTNTLNYKGEGTVTGGSTNTKDGAGIDISPAVTDSNVNVTFTGTKGLIQGSSNGIEVGQKVGSGDDKNKIVVDGTGTVQGNQAGSDGIHVYESSNLTNITVKGGATVQGKDDGIDAGSGTTLLVDGKSTINGDTDKTGGGDGIQGNDNNNIHVTGGSKVNGDPGVLLDDGNTYLVDGGAEVNADPGDGINVDDDNSVTVGGAGGAGYVKATNGGNGIALTDGFDNDGNQSSDNSITIGKDGHVLVSGTGNGNGIVVGQVGDSSSDNAIVIQDGGEVKVTNADGHGVVVNGQNDSANNNTVTIDDGGLIDVSGDGVRLLGDEYVSTAQGAANGGGDSIFSDGDGVDNDLVNKGIIRAAHNGVLVSNTNSDVDNSGGEIYAGSDGIRLTTIHTDTVDGDTKGFGETESSYQSDADSVIVAGRDGIHYDNTTDDAGNADALQVNDTGKNVDGLGETDTTVFFIVPVKGDFPEVVTNEGTIEAGRHGISVNSKFDVTNESTGVIIAGGLPGKTATGGDGIRGVANNTITNDGTIAVGASANKDSDGIQVTGVLNSVTNTGIIDTTGSQKIDRINNGTLEKGVADAQDDGKGGDGIHATANAQKNLTNDNGVIIAEDDGIDALSGDGLDALANKTVVYQKIENINGSSITAKDNGIVAGDWNKVTNDATSTITADSDGSYWADAKGGSDGSKKPAGINVGDVNVVTNDGKILGNGDGINAGSNNGGALGKITNSATGEIDVGGNGIQFVDKNDVSNAGKVTADVNGVYTEGSFNSITNTGTITGGGNGVNGGNADGAGVQINGGQHNAFVGSTGTIDSQKGSLGDGVQFNNAIQNSLSSKSITGDDDGVVFNNSIQNSVNVGVGGIEGRTGNGIETQNSIQSVVISTGNVKGGDDGVHIEGSSGTDITVTGSITGDTDGKGGGDGVEIKGGSGNKVLATGAISGDPGVIITGSSQNNVQGASIAGTNGGVVITNGSSNIVTTTSGDITGGKGDGVNITTGSKNIVTSAAGISGSDGVEINANGNEVYANNGDIKGTWDGVSIDGNKNTVEASGAITGTKAEGIQIDGDDNGVTAGAAISGAQDAVTITGNRNTVGGATITSTNGDGVAVDGNNNEVTSDGVIDGHWDGVQIDGNKNTVDAGGAITGAQAEGVQISGDQNNVTADGEIKGAQDAVTITGDKNSVAGTDITSTGGNAITIDGDKNDVTADGAIKGDVFGVHISGDKNDVSGDSVTSTGEDAVNISGDSNGVDIDGAITGGHEGVVIDGANNTVEGASIGGSDTGFRITGDKNSITIDDFIHGDTDGGGLGSGGFINGDFNIVSAGGDISANAGTGDYGVSVTGDNNTVSGANIKGVDNEGVAISGSTNTVTATGDISSEKDDALSVDGSGNIVKANKISGHWDGVDISNGDGNKITVGAGGVTGAQGDGVDVSGNSNIITSAGSVSGNDDGVVIDGGGNSVKVTGSITGTNGDGVDITGSTNTVSATGAISGDPGVIINGSSNNVSSASISATNDAVNITGSSNIVTTGAITSTNADGIEIVSGTNNTITASSVTGGASGALLGINNDLIITGGGAIEGKGGIGVQVKGSSTVTGVSTIKGSTIGADVDGNNNSITATGNISGGTGVGVDIDGSTNTVTTNGEISSAGDDAVDVDGDGNVVKAGSIKGFVDGVDLSGNTNTITVATGTVSGQTGDGVNLFGLGNNVLVSNGGISGGANGVVVLGTNTSVVAFGDIKGTTGNGVSVEGLNNVVAAAGDGHNISGGTNGVLIEGTGNKVNGNNITGNNGDGVSIVDGSDGNGVAADGDVHGTNDGVHVEGNTNTVTVGGAITGDNGDGVDIKGASNIVKAEGAITGDPGVIIVGANNTVSSKTSITGTVGDGVNVTGDGNTVSTLGAIKGAQDGIEVVFGSNNTFTAGSVEGGANGAILGFDNDLKIIGNGTSIEGKGGVGVKVSGNSSVTSSFGNTAITGSTIGADVDGNNNVIAGGGAITGKAGIGLDIDGNTNSVNASGVTGGTSGATIDGTSNTVTIGGGGIIGKNGDGLAITGGSNIVGSGGNIEGTDDGVEIDGSSNGVTVTGAIGGSSGSGVDIDGSSNTVKATANIAASGDGVTIVGNGNTVSSGFQIVSGGAIGANINGNLNGVSAVQIVGSTGGAIINGDQNTVTATDDITTTNGYAVGITGNQNVVKAADDITSTNSDAVNIAGNQNQVSGNDITGGADGIQINGNQNFVDVGATVTAKGGHGVWFDSGTGNNVDLTGVSVTASVDGVHVDVDGNEFQHDAGTSITAGDDGIEFEYGGLVNAYESLVWKGTINAADDGVVLGGNWFTVINQGTINADTDKNSDGNGITAQSNNNIENAGTGVITGFNGIVGDDNNIVTNSLGGKITVTGDGILLDDNNTVKNDGTITAGDDGIEVDDNNVVSNSGSLSIHAKDDGIVAGDGNKITNTGWIEADSDKNSDGDGIHVDNKNLIDNSGKIQGWNGVVGSDSNTVNNNAGGLIDVTNNGIKVSSGNTVTNASGATITAGNIGIDAASQNTVKNGGTITAVNIGINATSNNTVENTGTVSGTKAGSGVGVALGSGNTLTNASGASITGADDGVTAGSSNTVTNSGTVTGTAGDGVDINGASNTVTNNATGVIKGDDNGIEIDGSSNTVTNANNIIGTKGDGVAVLSGSGNTITNSDLITGGDDGVDFNSGDNNLVNTGSVSGANNGVEMSGNSQYVYNNGSIDGAAGDGVHSEGDSATITNDNGGSITGSDDGIEIDGSHNDIVNEGIVQGDVDGIYVVEGSDNDIWNYNQITGSSYDGIEIEDSTDTYVYNSGSITGAYDGIENWAHGQAGTLQVWNEGGIISGGEDDGIYTEGDTGVANEDGGTITGYYDGIHADWNADLYVWNSEGSSITGQHGDGIYTWSDDESDAYVAVYNAGQITGAVHGIHNDGNYDVYVANYATGVIRGTDAGYLYEDNGYDGNAFVEIDNSGLIEVTGAGVLPTPPADTEEDTAVNLDMINGEDAAPVAAIDTRDGGPGLEAYIFNWGTIQGANEFSVDNPETTDVDESGVQLTNRFAILGGAGEENIANFAGGTINGDIATQAGDDVLAMEIGSHFNGDADLGQTLETAGVLGLIPDDPETEEVDESAGGTAVGFVKTASVDTGVDAVVLFGEGYQAYNGDITEAEVLYVNDRITQADIYYGEDAMAAAVVPGFESQPAPVGTWSLNGNVKIDGTNLWSFVNVDTDGDGVADEEATYVSGTLATIVDNGRLNIGATEPVEYQTTGDLLTQSADGTVTNDKKGDGVNDFTIDGDAKTDILYDKVKLQTFSTAVLTSPVVDVYTGGTLGGHGTIVTNPGANGGNGGVNLTGAVQGDKVVYFGADADHIQSQFIEGEARGSFIVGTTTGDLVTQSADGKVTDATKGDGTPDFKIVPAEDAESDPTTVELQYTVDADGHLYPAITLPTGFIEETGPAAFDFVTDSPRYATLAPGDEINRVGTLTVYGNVTMDGKQTATTSYVVAIPDDPATEDVDESKDGTATKTQTGRTVVTNWGSQFQADLRDDGTGDRLNVLKTGITKAFTGGTFDTTGLGTVDLVTQDAEGTVTDNEAGDGVKDFDIVVVDDVETKVDRKVAGAGGPDGVPDGVAYKVSTVLDGHVTVDGRLDIRLDGEFTDAVNNSQPATIPDPEGPTGCGDDPDGADSCPQVPNPAYAVPDGIPDVDAKGIATPHADFSKDAKVWDIIVAQGGVSGKFDEKGFDGGANDGAVIVRPDDPSTAADEEVRVQLLKAYLQYLPDRVRIISIPNFEPKGTTLNQTLTGEYLDSLTKYGLNEDALHAAIALVGTATDIPAALDALHPEWYNAFNEVGFSIARGAEQQAYIRTIEAQGFSGGQQNRVVMNVGDSSAVGQSASDKRATFWLAGSWGNSSIDDGRNEGWLEYKYETLTGYAGFDYMINPNFLIGILGGFSNSDVDARNASGNKGDVDSWQVGGYVSYFTHNWFLNAGGGIGDMNIESIRNINFGSGIGNISEVANAKYDGDVAYFYGKGGYSFDLGNSGWMLSPELALSYVKVKQDGFSETGTGNAPVFLLDVDKQSVSSFRGTAQVRLSKTFLAGNGGGWMPYVRVGLANEFKDDLRPITSGFQGAPGTSFTVFGQVPRQTTVIFGAGISGKVSDSFSLYLDYSGEIGGSFSEHVISGGARFHF